MSAHPFQYLRTYEGQFAIVRRNTALGARDLIVETHSFDDLLDILPLTLAQKFDLTKWAQECHPGSIIVVFSYVVVCVASEPVTSLKVA